MDGYAAIQAYESLGKRFKVGKNESTVLAGIVAVCGGCEDSKLDGVKAELPCANLPDCRGTVICLATGNRCLGPARISDDGTTVSDCHAEVLAKRGLRLFLARQIRAALSQPDSPLVKNSIVQYKSHDFDDHQKKSINLSLASQCYIGPGVKLRLVVSEIPCGDCSILNSINPKFSGAKPFHDRSKREADGKQDIGILRWKSGRHNIDAQYRSLSVSCSDKITSWLYHGLEGPFLSLFIRPVKLDAITLTCDCINPEESSRCLSEDLLQSTLPETAKPASRLSQYPPYLLAFRNSTKYEKDNDFLKAIGRIEELDSVVNASWRALVERVPGMLPKSDDFSVRISSAVFPASPRRPMSCDPSRLVSGLENISNPVITERKTKQSSAKGAIASSGTSLLWVWEPSYIESTDTKPKLVSIHTLKGEKLFGSVDLINQKNGRIAQQGRNLLKEELNRNSNITDHPRVCKANQLKQFVDLSSIVGWSIDPEESYYDTKLKALKANARLKSVRDDFFSLKTFEGWNHDKPLCTKPILEKTDSPTETAQIALESVSTKKRKWKKFAAASVGQKHHQKKHLRKDFA